MHIGRKTHILFRKCVTGIKYKIKLIFSIGGRWLRFYLLLSVNIVESLLKSNNENRLQVILIIIKEDCL